MRAEVVLLAVVLFASIAVWKFTQLFYRKRIEALNRKVAALKAQLPPEPVEAPRPAQISPPDGLRPDEIVKEILNSGSGDMQKFFEWMLANREVSQIAIDGMRSQCGLPEDAFARACGLGLIATRTERNAYGWGAKTGTVEFYSVAPQFRDIIARTMEQSVPLLPGVKPVPNFNGGGVTSPQVENFNGDGVTSPQVENFNGDAIPHRNGVHLPVSTPQMSHQAFPGVRGL